MKKANIYGQGSGSGVNNINSIQRGITLVTSDYTNINISEVDISKSIITIKNAKPNYSINRSIAIITFNSSTQIKIYCAGGYGEFEWEIIEFGKIKSLQKGSYILTKNNVVENISINPVDPSKCIFTYGQTSNHTGYDMRTYAFAWLESSTSVSTQRYIDGGQTNEIYWYLVELE